MLLKVFRKLSSLRRSISKYFIFIFQIIGWVIVLYIVTPLLASLSIPIWGASAQDFSIGNFILLITAAFILAYTYETKKLREETILQRKMAVANDIEFRMSHSYFGANPDRTNFGVVITQETLNSVSSFTFFTAILQKPLGRCGQAYLMADNPEFIKFHYFIETKEDRKKFLQTLKLQAGQIQARVLITNGTEFIYTFKARTDNWKKALLEGGLNLTDDFILIKKELYES